MSQISQLTIYNPLPAGQNGEVTIPVPKPGFDFTRDGIALTLDKRPICLHIHNSDPPSQEICISQERYKALKYTALATVPISLIGLAGFTAKDMQKSNDEVIVKEKQLATFKAGQMGKDCAAAKNAAKEAAEAITSKLPHKPSTIKALEIFGIASGLVGIGLLGMSIITRINNKDR